MSRFVDIAHNAQAWAQALDQAQIPVLQRTVQELARLREDEENVVARDIARVLNHDPMFTLLVLRYLQAHRRAKQTADITTVEHAIMMLGVSPFFAHFADLPAVESALQDLPAALEGLMHVAFRAHHAALYACDWATLRFDARTDEVANAALLHDLAEIMVWCFAPDRSLQVVALMRANAGLRSGAAQRSVLGFELAELQGLLIAQWGLPALLQSLMEDSHATRPRTRNVSLAVDLARHSAFGWDDPALPDDFTAIGELLKLTQPEVLGRIRHVAIQAHGAHDWYRLPGVPVPENLVERCGNTQDRAQLDDS